MSAIVTPFAGPPVNVDTPTREPQRFGLFSVASMNEDPDPKFENGAQWEPFICDPARIVSGVCFDSSTDPGTWPEGWPLTTEKGVPLVDAQPFSVYGWYDCSAFSHSTQEADARARQHLALGEERAAEQAIWSGLYDNEPNFTTATDLTPVAGAQPLKTGIGILEGYLGTDYGSPGVLHFPRSVIAEAGGAVERAGQRLQTKLGNFVVAGSGYELAQDVDFEGGTADLYATSVPHIMRSQVFTVPDPEFRPARTNNDLTIFAWRVYLVAWECVTAKVTVNISQ